MSPLFSQTEIHGQHGKALKIIAKSLFRELKQHGYDSHQIVSVSTELLELVTSDLQGETPSAPTF